MTNNTKEGNMLDLKEEKQYKRLKKLGQELHLPIPEAFIELEVRDKDGNVIQRHRQRSHSWVRNAYNLLFVQLAGKGCTGDGFGAGKISIRETDTTLQDLVSQPIVISGINKPDDVGHAYREGAGEIVHGILVGSGINAEDFEDYVLQTPIAEGTGAGELNAVASEPNSLSYADTTLTNTLIRYFNNNTLGETSVDVNEVCIVAHGIGAGAAADILMSRDHLTSTVTVPSTGQLKVTYTISLTYTS